MTNSMMRAALCCGAFWIGSTLTSAAAWAGPKQGDAPGKGALVVVAQGRVSAGPVGGGTGEVRASSAAPPGLYRVSPGGYVKLLFPGGCVVRGDGGSFFEVQLSASGGCVQVEVRQGKVGVSAPRGKEARVRVGGLKARVSGGALRAVASKPVRVCAFGDGVQVGGPGASKVLQPPPKKNPASPAPSETGDAKPSGEGGSSDAEKASAKEGESEEKGSSTFPAKPREGEGPPAVAPRKKWAPLPKGQCLAWGKTVGDPEEQEEESAGVCPPVEVPEVAVDLEPVLPAGKKRGDRGGKGGGSDSVSAGAGGSMCLDSSGSGSGASSVSQGPSGIQKPPPKTRVKIRVRLPWR